jgi:hypothetical protein
MSPDIVANQLLGRPMPAQGGATNVMPASRFNMMPQSGVTPAITSGANEMGQTMASGRFNMMPPQSPAVSVLPPIPQAVQQPTDNLTPPSDMTVSAMIPEGITGQTELAPQYVEQPMSMAIPQASQFQTYRPPELRIPQFNPRNIMQQPSVSETLRLPGELKAYQAETKAQIDAYKANVTAQRNAIRDSLDAQLKGQRLRKGELDIISSQISNQFSQGGPQYGVFNAGGKDQGYVFTSPKSIRIFDIEPKKTAGQQSREARAQMYDDVISRLREGDRAGAAEAFLKGGGKPDELLTVETLLSGGAAPIEPEASVQKPAAKPTTTSNVSRDAIAKEIERRKQQRSG